MTIPLYRHCIHPRIPQLAVLGYGDSFSTMFTSEMMSKWLICLLEGSFQLPTIEEMEKDVLKWMGCTKMYKRKPLHWTCIKATNIWYNDQLCIDMGHNPKRKNISC
uniref:Flavin-containing monooxygenase n=1 Tax=Arundo donax TaxID=35708 RepID=A0A0A8YC75_ARUDO